MKSLLRQWENDVTVMVDTRIESRRAKCMRTKDYEIIATDKPFRGIIMQIHKRLEPEVIEIDNENANYVAVTINTNGKKIGIVGIYGPNNDDPKFYKDTINKVVTNLVIKTDDIILAGDFNISLSDSVGYVRNGSYKKDAFAECVKIWNCKDIIECKAKKNYIKPITYIHTTKNNYVNRDIFPLKAARLDGIFTTIDTAAVRATIGKFYPSDHASVRAEFPENKDIGKKVWKLNVNHLRDGLLVERWKKIANNLTETNEFFRTKLETEYEITDHRVTELLGKDALKKWNELLVIIKAMSIEKNKKRIEENNAKRDKVLTRQEIKVLEKENLNYILDELNKNESEKAKIRTELKNYELNATNKKLVKHEGKLENQSRNISKIIIGDQVLTNSKKIKEGIQKYYKYQFRCQCKNKKVPKPCAICKSNPIHYAKVTAKNFKKKTFRQKRIMNNMKEKLEQDITIQELDSFVNKKLKSKMKSPGPDGIPYELFNIMWKEIRRLIFKIVNWIFKNKIMPEELPEGLIVFLPKKGKDKKLIKNLRPLTLLNTLYKIASGVMVERIKSVLPSIISKDQYSFMKGKQAADLIEITREIIKDAKVQKKNLSIFAIDFSAAFDNVTYKAIIDALYRRGFGKNFTTNVATLLTNNRSRIMVNGKYINSINIEKSCRQGDPISPYLFIIVLDQLLDKINYAKSLKGYELKFGKRKIKIKSADFADDCYTFLTGNKKEIEHQFETVKKLLKTFEADTGLKINVAKSELTLSGPIAKESELNIGGIVSKRKIKMLGVNVGEESNLSNDIFNTLTAKMKFWEKFHYNEVDRIEILNAFVIPSVTHMLRHVPFNKSMELRLSKMTSDFVWGKKRRYISKDILFQNIKSGGMGAVSIGKVWLKVVLSWLMRALNPENRAPVMDVAGEKYEKKYGHKISSFLCHGIIAEKRIKKSDSVLESAFEVGRKMWSDYLDNESYENQPLIGNKRILKDAAKTTIDALNLPAFDETTIPTTVWLEEEIERINQKPIKTLTEILTAHLKNRLDPRRKPE